MAKVKLDWFKLDCQMDDKIKLVEAEFGLTGFAIVVKLWQKIYGSEGYYCEWNDDVALVFAKECGVGANVVSEIISGAVRRGVFDKGMLDEFGILTSHGVQSRYFDSEYISRRKCDFLKPEYLLVQCTQKSKNAGNSSKNADIYSKNADTFSQSREEKKRVDKSRAEEKRAEERRARTREQTPITESQPNITFGYVDLTPEQYSILTMKYPKRIVDEYIQRVDDYCKSKGRGYPNYPAKIAQWIDEDVSKGKTSLAEPSHDVNEWQDLAMDIDPSALGDGKDW